ncbi:MAG: biotin transporter BioY [Clostridia bacterium]|nr:biotin transporter BioY [Clostridia bacterium]
MHSGGRRAHQPSVPCSPSHRRPAALEIRPAVHPFLSCPGGTGTARFCGLWCRVGGSFWPHGRLSFGLSSVCPCFDLLCRKKRSFPSFLVSGLLALSCCYLLGSVWYLIYLPEHSLLTTLSVCILPYLLPDLLKILLASLVLCALKGRRISSRQDAD